MLCIVLEIVEILHVIKTFGVFLVCIFLFFWGGGGEVWRREVTILDKYLEKSLKTPPGL